MKEILIKFEKEFSDYLDMENSFVCVYGSQIYDPMPLDSDIDVFFAFKNPQSVDFALLEERIIKFHINNNLKLDNEVSYRNKLLVSYNDVDRAASIMCFDGGSDIVMVPRVIKTKKFLNSQHIRERLIFNTLTSPHLFLGSDHRSYRRFKRIASKNLLILAKNLLGNNEIDMNSILNILLRSDSGEEGEFYLGYKKIDPIITHLKRTIKTHKKHIFF